MISPYLTNYKVGINDIVCICGIVTKEILALNTVAGWNPCALVCPIVPYRWTHTMLSDLAWHPNDGAKNPHWPGLLRCSPSRIIWSNLAEIRLNCCLEWKTSVWLIWLQVAANISNLRSKSKLNKRDLPNKDWLHSTSFRLQLFGGVIGVCTCLYQDQFRDLIAQILSWFPGFSHKMTWERRTSKHLLSLAICSVLGWKQKGMPKSDQSTWVQNCRLLADKSEHN